MLRKYLTILVTCQRKTKIVRYREAKDTEMNLNKITEKIIGCSIEVHGELGTGLLESIYESALYIELKNYVLKYERQKVPPVEYKESTIDKFRIDLLVENSVVVELKSLERFDSVFESQILTYMKLSKYKVGLLILIQNYSKVVLNDTLFKTVFVLSVAC